MKLLLPFFALLTICSNGQTATEILEKSELKMRGNTLQAEIILQIVRPGWMREMKIKTWMKGRDLAVILVTSPAREKGITFLKRQREVWNWIPALEKTIKLPPSMMSQSWMGTDFTNDDLVKESSIVRDYTHRLLGDTLIDGRSCHLLELLPLPETAVVWGKIITAIDKKDYMEMMARFYDEEGALMNSMYGYDVKMMDGRWIPTRYEMIPADKKGQKTVLRYESILFDRPLEDRFFSIDHIRKIAY